MSDHPDIDWYRTFFTTPTGFGSDGGYRYMQGHPREIPGYLLEDSAEDRQAFLNGYDLAAKLFPNEGNGLLP